jgi:hypothetical protein
MLGSGVWVIDSSGVRLHHIPKYLDSTAVQRTCPRERLLDQHYQHDVYKQHYIVGIEFQGA